MSQTTKHLYEFGPFRLDPAERQLWRGQEEISLTAKAFDILLLLVRNGGRTVPKDEFMRTVWPDTTVEEGNLTDNISTLRQILQDDAREPRYIQTVPKRGYRFVAETRQPADDVEFVFRERSTERVVIEEERSALPSARSSQMPMVAGAVVLAAIVLAAAVYALMRATPANDVRPRTIAILPFKPLVPSSRVDAALELGMTDALITKLSNVHELTVRPTASVMKYMSPDRDFARIAKELGVEALLDGRVQRSGDRVHVTVQLVRAEDGRTIWGDQFNETFTDIFALQEKIAERVASALALRLSTAERQSLARHATANVEAYELYLNGRYHWSTFTGPGLRTSINYFNAAIAKDPNFALAWVGLANAHTVMGIWAYEPKKDAVAGARVAVAKALELDPDLALAHVAAAGLSIFNDWDWDVAKRETERALELDPDNADAHTLHGYYLQSQGKPDEALQELLRARAVAPEWTIAKNDVLWGLIMARRYDDAIAESRRILAIDPDYREAHYILGRALAQKGQYDEAGDALREAQRRSAASSFRYQPELAWVYARSGRRAEALAMVEGLKKSLDENPWLALELAEVYCGLGDPDRAFAMLERSYQERAAFTWRVRLFSHFDVLRNDPRYADLMRRMNLEP